MEQINPYAVIRNTATYEAFKAYHRKAMGQPYLSLGFLLAALGPAGAMAARVFFHRPSGDGLVALACYLVPVSLAVVLMVVSGMKASRFRKANPMPDEWRQVPRIRVPLVPGRKPPPPWQG